MEASFFVDAEALRRIKPDTRSDEIGLLGAFDFEPQIDLCDRSPGL